jgi:hypothetical protein
MTEQQEKKNICGVVMPISAIDGCTEAHWVEVLEIFSESIENSGFEPNLVSNADDVGIIQKRIIQNLYENPIVVCDVSGKNPNVMFELGMRLAFDRPTIIVKDDQTSYSFDTSPIEHLEYPRDLRFKKIMDFKSKLTDKIMKTYEAASKDASYTTFLKHFGAFKVAKLDTKEVTSTEFIMDELRNLRNAVMRLNKPMFDSTRPDISISKTNYIFQFKSDELDNSAIEMFMGKLRTIAGIDDVVIRNDRDQGKKVYVSCSNEVDSNVLKQIYEESKLLNNDVTHPRTSKRPGGRS